MQHKLRLLEAVCVQSFCPQQPSDQSKQHHGSICFRGDEAACRKPWHLYCHSPGFQSTVVLKGFLYLLSASDRAFFAEGAFRPSLSTPLKHTQQHFGVAGIVGCGMVRCPFASTSPPAARPEVPSGPDSQPFQRLLVQVQVRLGVCQMHQHCNLCL